MINRRHLLLGAGAIGLAAVGCTRTEGETADGALTVGLTYIPNVQFSAFYLGLAEGIFADHGLDVTLRHHGQQEELFGAVLRGQEDVVFASADEGVVAAAQGNDLVTFATSYQRYPIEVVAAPGVGLADLSELRGRSLGITGHFGSSYYAALAALHTAGLTPDDVHLTDIGYTTVTALTTAKVDCAMGFRNNELVQLAAQGIEVDSLPVSAEGSPNLVGPSLLAPRGKLSDDLLRALADAMKEAEEAVIADPAAALEATAKEVPALADPAQRESAEQVLAATTELWAPNGEVSVAVDPDAMDRMAAFLVEAGIIDAAPEDFYLA